LAKGTDVAVFVGVPVKVGVPVGLGVGVMVGVREKRRVRVGEISSVGEEGFFNEADGIGERVSPMGGSQAGEDIVTEAVFIGMSGVAPQEVRSNTKITRTIR
jgi:hypothetical protein